MVQQWVSMYAFLVYLTQNGKKNKQKGKERKTYFQSLCAVAHVNILFLDNCIYWHTWLWQISLCLVLCFGFTQFPPETLYCCNEYREFVDYVMSTTRDMEEEQNQRNKLIDIKPHEHVGSKQERNAAREKAVQR